MAITEPTKPDDKNPIDGKGVTPAKEDESVSPDTGSGGKTPDTLLSHVVSEVKDILPQNGEKTQGAEQKNPAAEDTIPKNAQPLKQEDKQKAEQKLHRIELFCLSYGV